MSHQVTAPYVTLRVTNNEGQEVISGFYEGAVLPAGVNNDDLQRHLRKGMIAKAGSEAEPTVTQPEAPKPIEQPAASASRKDWAAYAASKDAPQEETAEGGLTRDQLREKYGN